GFRVHNDSQAWADAAGTFGRAFGSQMSGLLTEGESPFVQLAAGTVIGTLTQNLAEAIGSVGYHAFKGDLSQFNILGGLRQIDDIHLDFLGSAAGSASSFLLAELGESLGLEGFSAQLFNTVGSSYVGSITDFVLSPEHTAADLLAGGVDWGDAFTSLSGAVGAYFGSSLAGQILPAETVAGSIGGSLGSIAGGMLAGAAFGSLSAGVGATLGSFLVPGVGAFFGTMIGTAIGNLFGNNDDPTGRGYVYVNETNMYADWEDHVEGGLSDTITDKLGLASRSAAQQFLDISGGVALANPVQTISLDGNSFDKKVPQYFRVEADSDGALYFSVRGVSVATAEELVEAVVFNISKEAQVIGGDLLLKRAVANSEATDTSVLSGHIAVAEDYTQYLNEREVTNALIVADPLSAFAAGWVVTLAQAQELELEDVAESDFNGGLQGFLASIQEAGLAVDPSDVTVKYNSADTSRIYVDIALGDDEVVPGELSVFADSVTEYENPARRFLRLAFWDSMSKAGYSRVTGPYPSGESTGRDLWFAPAGEDTIYTDPQGRQANENSEDILIGGAGIDQISGGSGDDWIDGGRGNDRLYGASGTDMLFGGDGADTLNGDDGDDTFEGGAGGDSINGDNDDPGYDTASYARSTAAVRIDREADTAFGGHAEGDSLNSVENLIGSKFNDELTGHDGENTLEGGAGADRLNGDGDYDVASYAHAASGVTASLADRTKNTGDAAGDVYVSIEDLEGSIFADSLEGNSGANWLTGGHGDDVLTGGAGADDFIGGTGFDTVSYSSAATAVDVDLQGDSYWGDAAGDTFETVEGFVGSDFNDRAYGGDAANKLEGGRGNDTLYGYGGSDELIGWWGEDTLYGGAGADILRGGNDNDTITGDATSDDQTGDGDAIEGGNGDDKLYGRYGDDFIEGGFGADIVDGGDGVDTAGYATSTDGVTVNLRLGTASGGHAQGDQLDGIENLIGSDHADVLAGGAVNNVLDGGGGLDEFFGGTGNDTFIVDHNQEVVHEVDGQGSDTVYAKASYALRADVFVESLQAFDRFDATALNLTGNDLVNTLHGNAGANRLNGGREADRLYGYEGDDTYTVDNAGDIIVESAGQGLDTLYAATTYTLRTGVEIERLRTIDGTDTREIDLTGNDLANVIFGNNGANRLNGRGGVDNLYGYHGDDVYYVDDADDIVGEAAVADFDRVVASVIMGWTRVSLWSSCRRSMRTRFRRSSSGAMRSTTGYSATPEPTSSPGRAARMIFMWGWPTTLGIPWLIAMRRTAASPRRPGIASSNSTAPSAARTRPPTKSI
nr:hypothetical protein [Hyphomicrobiales bacterium]